MPLSNETVLLFVCSDGAHNHDIQAICQHRNMGIVLNSQFEPLSLPRRNRSALGLLDHVALRRRRLASLWQCIHVYRKARPMSSGTVRVVVFSSTAGGLVAVKSTLVGVQLPELAWAHLSRQDGRPGGKRRL